MKRTFKRLGWALSVFAAMMAIAIFMAILTIYACILGLFTWQSPGKIIMKNLHDIFDEN